MGIKVRRQGRSVILETGKSVTLKNIEDIRASFKQLIEDGERRVILDLAQTGQIDSAGLGELTMFFNQMRRVNGQLSLLHLTQRVESVLAVVKLTTVFDVYTTESEAVAAQAA